MPSLLELLKLGLVNWSEKSSLLFRILLWRVDLVLVLSVVLCFIFLSLENSK